MTTISSGLPSRVDFEVFRGSRFSQRVLKAYIVDGAVPDWSSHTAIIEIFDNGTAISATATITQTNGALSYVDPNTGDTVDLGTVDYYSIDVVIDDEVTAAIVQSRRLATTITVSDVSGNDIALMTGYTRVYDDGQALGATADDIILVVDTLNDLVLVVTVDTTDGGLQSVQPGTNVVIDNTDPLNPIINALIPGGAGDVVGPSSSVDNELALFSGTTGKLLKRATETGLAYLTSGVLSALSRLSSLAQLPQIGTARILGRTTAGTGDPEELSKSTVLTFLNVADGATANSSDATLLARANHTGTQTISTVTGLQTALDGKETVGAAATVQSNLDSHEADSANPHSVTTGQIGAEPTQTPASQAEAEAGTEAAIRSFSPLRIAQAIAALAAGAVSSVFGRSGAVTAQSGDYNADQITETASNKILTSAERTKLAGIETGATADQTAGEIKTLYESNADTNAFTDADESKLDGIEAGATADQSDSEIEIAYNNQVSIVAQAEAEAGVATTVRRWTAERVNQAIQALAPGGSSPLTTKGDLYTYDTDDARLPVGSDGEMLYSDSAETTGLRWGAPPSGSGDVSGPASSVDDEIALFSGASGKVIKRASGTGVALLTSGVLSTGTVGTSEITDAAVTLAKMANLAANSIIGNNTGSAATPIALTAAQVKTLLAIAIGDVAGLQTALDDKLGSTDIDTLAELNAILTDAILIDTGDSRLSDARTPTSHAASHRDSGSDALIKKIAITNSDGGTITQATHGLASTSAMDAAIFVSNNNVSADISIAENGDVTWATTALITGHIVIFS